MAAWYGVAISILMAFFAKLAVAVANQLRSHAALAALQVPDCARVDELLKEVDGLLLVEVTILEVHHKCDHVTF